MYYRVESLASVGGVLISGGDQRVSGLSHTFFRSPTDAKWLKNVLASLIQDAIPHTKILKLAVEKAPASVSVVIECDRSAESLHLELDGISEMVDSPPEETASSDRIELSTGLVLAIAQTTLPLIKGTFAIAPIPGSEDRAALRCTFPIGSTSFSG